MNLEAVYPQHVKGEFCFEELRAQRRRWQPKSVEEQRQRRAHEPQKEQQAVQHDNNLMESVQSKGRGSFRIFEDPLPSPAVALETELVQKMEVALTFLDENNENRAPDEVAQARAASKKARREERANRTRKIQVMDVKHIPNETKTIQLNMDSPQSTKAKRKKSSHEQTMTINTKEAMEEIYDIFSQQIATSTEQDSGSEAETDSSELGTTDAESTATGKLSAPNSEYGEDTRRELYDTQPQNPQADIGDLTGWSDQLTDALTEHDLLTTASLPVAQDDLTTGYHDESNQSQDLLNPYDNNTVETQQIPILDESFATSRRHIQTYGGVPNNRLPFMTPIAELTESSLGMLTVNKQRELLSTKTPSRQTGIASIAIDQDELMSSPFQEITDELVEVKKRILQPVRTKSTKGTLCLGSGSAQAQHEAQVASHFSISSEPSGPIIQDLQCNPMDPALRDVIISRIQPLLISTTGYHQYVDTEGCKTADIKRWAKAVAKATRTSAAADKAGVSTLPEPVIAFGPDCTSYHFRRELGAGTFAPVFLVEANRHDIVTDVHAVAKTIRKPCEAIKMEDPPSVWEWYIIQEAHRRLANTRSDASVIRVHEMHVYKDECFLVEDYCEQGTLLDLVNSCRMENTANAGMDEMLAMWCAVELLRTVEALHAQNLVHGDLKGDNIMVRFDDPGCETDWSSTYFPSGSHGWSSKGVCLIDFGRGIDMTQFEPDVAFVADWKTTEADCAEMREMRPWTYQIDYHGLAGTLHSMLFGKYMEIVAEKGAGLGQGVGKTYRIHDGLKRYWQTEIWSEVFELLLNPLRHVGGEANGKMPVLNGMRACREKMEAWLENNCEKGIGLKGMISKLECVIKEKKRRRRS